MSDHPTTLTEAERRKLAAALYRLEWNADLYATPRSIDVDRYERRADRLHRDFLAARTPTATGDAERTGRPCGAAGWAAYAAEQERHAGTAARLAAVRAVLLDSAHSGECEWDMTTGEWDCVCPLSDLLAALDDPTATRVTAGDDLRDRVTALADEWDACDEHGNPLREGSFGEAADELRSVLAPSSAPVVSLQCGDNKRCPNCTPEEVQCSDGCPTCDDWYAAAPVVSRPEAAVKAEALREHFPNVVVEPNGAVRAKCEGRTCDWYVMRDTPRTHRNWLVVIRLHSAHLAAVLATDPEAGGDS